MGKSEIILDGVSFAYEAGKETLMKDATLHFTRGWTGVVGANGAGKTTLMKLAIGELTPLEGRISTVDNAIYCEQRTDDPPEMLEVLIEDEDGEAFGIRGRLGIESDWLRRWQSLSHGERKRAQIGVALWRQPDVLAIDEPTNHLDAQALQLLASALSRFRGVGLLVSHDRQLLDELCQQCAFVDPPDVVMRPGGVTEGQEQERNEAESNVRQKQQAKRERQRLEREATARAQDAARADKRRSKRDLRKGDNDERFKRNLARVTDRDAVSGKLLRQMDGRLSQARDREA